MIRDSRNSLEQIRVSSGKILTWIRVRSYGIVPFLERVE